MTGSKKDSDLARFPEKYDRATMTYQCQRCGVEGQPVAWFGTIARLCRACHEAATAQAVRS